MESVDLSQELARRAAQRAATDMKFSLCESLFIIRNVLDKGLASWLEGTEMEALQALARGVTIGLNTLSKYGLVHDPAHAPSVFSKDAWTDTPKFPPLFAPATEEALNKMPEPAYHESAPTVDAHPGPQPEYDG